MCIRDRGKVNVNTELKTKSVKELVIENTCTLFNLINICLLYTSRCV